MSFGTNILASMSTLDCKEMDSMVLEYLAARGMQQALVESTRAELQLLTDSQFPNTSALAKVAAYAVHMAVKATDSAGFGSAAILPLTGRQELEGSVAAKLLIPTPKQQLQGTPVLDKPADSTPRRVGFRVALSGHDDGSFCLIDLSTGSCQTLAGHTDAVTCMTVDWSRSRALTCGSDGTVRLWDLGEKVCLKVLETSDVSPANCVVASWSHELAIVGSANNSVQLWDLATGECSQVVRTHAAPVMCVSADWSLKWALSGSEDTTLQLWDLELSKRLQVFRGHSSAVTCMAVNWGKHRALSGSDDGTLRVWDLNRGTSLRELTGHAEPVSCVVADWGRMCAVSGSTDTTLRLWDIDRGMCLRELCGLVGSHCPVQCLVVDWERQHALCGVSNGPLRVWDLRNGQCLREMRGGKEAALCLAAR